MQKTGNLELITAKLISNKQMIKFFIWAFFILEIFYLCIKNHSLIYTFMDVFNVIMLTCISVIAFNTYNIIGNRNTIYFGIAFGFVAIFDLFRIILQLEGSMKFFNMTLTLGLFWFIARLLESTSILITILMSKKQVEPVTAFLIYFSVSSTILISVFSFLSASISYSAATTNNYSIIAELIICCILLIDIFFLYILRKSVFGNIYGYIMLYLIASFAFEGIMLLGHSTALFNQLKLVLIGGQLIKFIALYNIYKAVCGSGLENAYIKNCDKHKQMNDALTGKTSELEIINQQLKDKIREQSIVEEELRESEERYRNLVELLPEGIYVHNNCKITYSNLAGAKLLKASSPSELLGRDILDFIVSDNQERVEQRIRGLTKAGEKTPLCELKYQCINGTIIEVEKTSIMLNDKANPLVLSVVRNISERKQAQELRKRIDENNKLLHEAVEYDKLKTEFFSNISHELRTPLNVILGTLQLFDMLMSNNTEISNQVKIRKYVNTMKQNCLRLLRLVNNLIDITKIDSGFFEIHLQNHNIVSIVEDITLSVAEYIENQGITLIFDTETEERILACDPDKIERILLNLLSNSVKFTKSGGHISVYIVEQEEYIIIKVKDDGIGIPNNKLQEIFERFRQVDKSFIRSREGSGIGLSLAKSLIELHGGSISVESTLGEGSEFTIVLPITVVDSQVNHPNSIVKQQSNIERINIEFSDIYSYY